MWTCRDDVLQIRGEIFNDQKPASCHTESGVPQPRLGVLQGGQGRPLLSLFYRLHHGNIEQHQPRRWFSSTLGSWHLTFHSSRVSGDQWQAACVPGVLQHHARGAAITCFGGSRHCHCGTRPGERRPCQAKDKYTCHTVVFGSTSIKYFRIDTVRQKTKGRESWNTFFGF